MEYEEIFEIIKRARKGENVEELIDFNKESICGLTPQQAGEFVNNALYCCSCKKPLKEDELFTCKECLDKAEEDFYKTELGKNFKCKKDNEWTWLLGLLVVASLFSNDDKNNDKNP